MVAGSVSTRIPESELLDDYYSNLTIAYNAMQDAFAYRASTGLTQDELAARLGVNKSLVSRRLNGRENLTMKTISAMASGMHCRLNIRFEPYETITPAMAAGITDKLWSIADIVAIVDAWEERQRRFALAR